MVYYRKYRPQTLTDLIGQESVKTALNGALKSDKLAHAYLFSGPRGTGKTSTARILAKMVNCQSQESRVKSQVKEKPRLQTLATSDLPCNKCDSCLSITDGSSLDLIEIDAASNRGIEEIRTLRENIKLSPTASAKKIYIIDEVHMLTTEAFNALLKTLEEPPSHVMFILATTDPQKIPATILSRVTQLDFKLAEMSELKLALEKIIKEEKLKIDDEVLNLICQKAGGSFRDAVKLLDQLSPEDLTLETALLALSASPNKQVLELLEKINQKDTKGSLLKLNEILETGVGVKDLTLTLLDNFRQMMLIKSDIKNPGADDLIELSEKFSLTEVIKVIDSLSDSLERGRYAAIAALPLEVAVVESCYDNNPDQPINRSTNQPLTDDVVIPITAVPRVGASEDMQKIAEKWAVILETARSYNYSLEALLRSSKIARSEENTVYIEVPYAFHQRMIEAPKSRDLVESILSDVLGRSIHISTILGPKPKRAEGLANIEVAADDEIVRIASEIFSS